MVVNLFIILNSLLTMSSSPINNATQYQLELAKSCLSLEKLTKINLKARQQALKFPVMM